jgi:hypothetical protein
VLVEWGGKWWNAHVVDVVGAASWKVHYDGWSDRWDETVSANRIASVARSGTPAAERPPGKRRPWLAAGLSIAGVVAALSVWVSMRSDRSREATQAPAPPPGTPMPPNTTLSEGEPVWGYSMSQWWRAEIVRRLPNGRYEVRYIGYDKTWNESLTLEQMRRRVE